MKQQDYFHYFVQIGTKASNLPCGKEINLPLNNINRKIEGILPRRLVKVFSFTALATIIRLLTSFVSMKVIAVITGTKGLVMLGNLNNFSSIVLIIASGGIINGVTKYASEHKGKPEEHRYFTTAAQITLFFSSLAAIVLLIGSSYFSKKVFLADGYQYLFIVLAFTLFLYSANTFFAAVLNGFKEFRRYTLINITNNIFGLVFTLVLIYFTGLKGVLLSVVTFQSASFIITWFLVRKDTWLNFSDVFSKIDWKIVKQYLQFSLMSLAAASIVPLAQVIIRNSIVKNISINAAGYWDGINRLSAVYLLLIISTYSPYYLPRISEINKKSDIKKEIQLAYRLILPLIFVVFLMVFVLRKWVISLLFAPAFAPMDELFLFQLIGDFFRIASWFLAFIMIAKAQYKTFIINELVLNTSLILLSFYFQNHYGIVGNTFAYMINYIMQFIFLNFWIRYYVNKKLVSRH